MGNFIDLTNKQFNHLKVLRKDTERSTKDRTYWVCKCECGNICSKEAYSIKTKSTLSCGCMSEIHRLQTIKNYNKYDLSGEYGIGYTSNTNEQFYFDLEDYDKIYDFYWYGGNKGYIMATSKLGGTKNINLHNLVMNNLDKKIIIDHENKLRFDCRKENLRECTKKENNYNRGIDRRNKSGITGVIYNKDNNAWQSYIRCDNIRTELGCYKNKEDAIIARLKAEKKYFGRFAPQKELFDKYNLDKKIIKNTKDKTVLCIETNITYSSCKECGNKMNIKPSNISRVCRGERKQTKGYHFKYILN